MSLPNVTFEVYQATARLELWPDEKTAELSSVSSHYKRRGLATKALRGALEFADHYDLEVLLTVSPFGTPGHQMEEAELKAWYMTFGFLNTGDNTMARPRKSVQHAERAIKHMEGPMKASVTDYVESMNERNPS